MNLNKKSVAVLLTAMAMTFVVGGCGKSQFGYVDRMRIEKESPQITAIVSEADTKMAQMQQEAQTKLAQDQPNMSAEDFQKEQQQEQMKLTAANQQYVMQVKQKVDAAMADIVKQKKLDVVVAKDQAAQTMVSGGVDITDDVIQKLQ